MHPRLYAESHPEKPALIMAETGEQRSYAELESLGNRGAQFLRKCGVKNGDIIALWARNSLEFLDVFWAAQRAGVYICPLPVYLSVDDAAYILENCGAKLLVVSSEIRAAEDFIDTAPKSLPVNEHIYHLHEPIGETASWAAALDDMPATPISDEEAGFHLIYSSGTTGRPKGVKLPLIGGPVIADTKWSIRYEQIYNLTDQSVFLACAPLYHSAPLLFATNTMRRGATIVITKKFTPESTLQAIQDYGVTMAQMVPTMFIRMLRLPEEERNLYDVSSLEYVIHAAAPCPREVKLKMMDWFGDIIEEYYAGSEANGLTTITSEEWRKRPGSVGRARNSIVHICDDAGQELPVGEIGNVYFEGGYDFEYLGEPEKTKNSRNPIHPTWSTLGDIGYVDDEGYLFLTDRKNFVIISGGVNIYPQETENLIIQHPKVFDVAIIGVPNEDMGEEMKAVIQPVDWADATVSFEQEIIEFCREKLGPIKTPKSVDFDQSLPRQENGKLYKRLLRSRYWPEDKSK